MTRESRVPSATAVVISSKCGGAAPQLPRLRKMRWGSGAPGGGVVAAAREDDVVPAIAVEIGDEDAAGPLPAAPIVSAVASSQRGAAAAFVEEARRHARRGRITGRPSRGPSAPGAQVTVQPGTLASRMRAQASSKPSPGSARVGAGPPRVARPDSTNCGDGQQEHAAEPARRGAGERRRRRGQRLADQRLDRGRLARGLADQAILD